MNIGTISLVVVAALVLLVVGFLLYRKRPRKLKRDQFVTQWRELQALCRDKTMWAQAILDADKLLDKALKRRRMKGKTMGARLVSAQRLLTDNDDVWFAHNLAKKIKAQADLKIKETDVKDALVGFRQALKDIGALPVSKADDTPQEPKS